VCFNCANVHQIIFFFAVFDGEAYRPVQGSTAVSRNRSRIIILCANALLPLCRVPHINTDNIRS